MQSKDIESVLMQAKLYKCLPSEVIGIDEEDTYTAFCFNEACMFIMVRLEKGEKPKYKVRNKKIPKQKRYKSFTEFYKKYET